MPIEAAMYRASPVSIGFRRPIASEIEPSSSWPRARPMRVAVMVSCTAAGRVPRSEVICGNAARYMSMVNGPMAVSAPSSRMKVPPIRVSQARPGLDLEPGRRDGTGHSGASQLLGRKT